MKKKIMAVTLCLAMVSTFAVGCGQKNETDSGKSEEKSSGKVEIEFVQVKREAAESYTKVIEAFEKENPDIVIKQNVVPDAQEVLMTRASSDSLPDMMNHWPTDAQFVQFEDEGVLLDLSEKDYMKNIDSSVDSICLCAEAYCFGFDTRSCKVLIFRKGCQKLLTPFLFLLYKEDKKLIER